MTEITFPLRGKRVWVAGHRGMVGAALMRRLAKEECEILTADHSQVDLRRQADTEKWIMAARPDAVFLAAARVGGIATNNQGNRVKQSSGDETCEEVVVPCCDLSFEAK